MKVLQAYSKFYPAFASGGVIRVMYEISKELVKRGHEVTVYTSDAIDRDSKIKDTNSPVDIDGITVYYLKSIFYKQAWVQKIFIMPQLLNIAREEIQGFDVIHLHECRGFLPIIIHHYAAKYGVPYVLQAHGSLTTFFHKGWLKRIFDTIWGYRVLKDASKAIAVTRTEAEQYKSMGVSEDKIEIVPNGIDLSEFDNLPERGEFRRKYGLNDNQRIILYLGRIHKIKGLDLLTKAFEGLTKELDDAKLVIVGPDDGYLPALKELIKELKIEEKVLITGPLYGEDKLEVYVDSDVYVLPSFYEIFGISILEALACGTPVIVTDRCGIANVINGQAGFVVSYDKDQMQNALLHLLNDDKMRQEFGEKGKLLVREKFNWQKIAEQVERVYKEII